MRYRICRLLNVLGIYLIILTILGAYLFQYLTNNPPCPLCHLQRLSMIFVTLGPVLNLRFGIHPRHYGLALLGCLMGGAVALHHICLHLKDGTPGPGKVLGMELYSWSLLIFVTAILGTSSLLFLYKTGDSQRKTPLAHHEKIAVYLLAVVTLIGVISYISNLR